MARNVAGVRENRVYVAVRHQSNHSVEECHVQQATEVIVIIPRYDDHGVVRNVGKQDHAPYQRKQQAPLDIRAQSKITAAIVFV